MTDSRPHPVPTSPEGAPTTVLGVDEIRERSLRGAKLVVLRGLLVKAILFLGSLVLARLLGPSQFGVIALGLTAMAFAQLLSDGGLAAGLIRRAEEPTRRELENVVGWQLLLTGTLAAVGVALGTLAGGTVLLVGLMLLALPVATLQVPGAVVLERSLRFGPRIVVELAEAVAWVVVAVGSVIMGAGIWGIAIATVVKPVAGIVAMVLVAPVGLVRPRLQWAAIRELVGFGVRFQAVGAVNLARDQGLNLLVLALGGYASLGLWALAFRMLQLPYLVLDSLWRVSYPAMSRLVSTGQDVRPVLRLSLGVVTVGTGVVLVALAATGHRLVPVVFGTEWAAAGEVIAPACAGLLVAGPVSVTAAGYLYARGCTRDILWAAVAHTLAWLLVTAALWSSLGIASVGWGWLAGSLVDATVLGRGLRRESGLRSREPTWRPASCALVSGAAGYWAAGLPAGDLLGATLGGTVALAGFLSLVLVVDRGSITSLRGVIH